MQVYLVNLARRPDRLAAMTGAAQALGLTLTRVEALDARAADPAIIDRVMAQIPDQRRNIFLILDSDHSARHVKRELDAWIPRLRSGDYVLVEDTVVNGNPVRPEHGPGPLEAVRQFIEENPGVLIADTAREAKFGATFAVEGYYTKA